MRFNEYSESERVQHVKNEFMQLLEELAGDPEKIKECIVIPALPKEIKPIIENISSDMTEETKAKLVARNEKAIANAKEINEKAKEEINNKLAQLNIIKESISKLKKVSDCICGTCLEIDSTSSLVPMELEPLIDVARKRAEERVY